MELLTSNEVAQRLGVPVSTVNYWRTAKKGPHYVKVGRHVRYLPESVDKYVLELMAAQEEENNDR
ncbi:helix-turn-helix transcriptional regulator [Corynebacterium phoceense]|uniref:helix-turn-helix transcriptional regulator n=1 Tax=Corynebacterium phoceense TaxID=1686286 RepID=UPI0018A922A3|nr:helix-turn-helix domain-containing protein [Corynebacterium phoceense]MBF9011696.1 helix-turn-helix domain-containing protein [Corynebacterium phoceense]